MRAAAAIGLGFGSLLAGACNQPGSPVARVEPAPVGVELAYPRFVDVELTWQILGPLTGLADDEEPLVFVHLLEKPGVVLRTFDHPLPCSWRVGASCVDRFRLYQSALAPPLTAGRYSMSVGLYDRSGRRWPLEIAGEDLGHEEYLAGTVEVPATPPAAPMFYFSPEWTPPQAGQDVQILARRWLDAAAGSIRVADLSETGRLWLELRLPESGLASGAVPEAAVRVEETCGGMEASLSGPGRHPLDLTVDRDAVERGDCRIEIRFADGRRREASSRLALEGLSWAPEGSG